MNRKKLKIYTDISTETTARHTYSLVHIIINRNDIIECTRNYTYIFNDCNQFVAELKNVYKVINFETCFRFINVYYHLSYHPDLSLK